MYRQPMRIYLLPRDVYTRIRAGEAQKSARR